MQHVDGGTDGANIATVAALRLKYVARAARRLHRADPRVGFAGFSAKRDSGSPSAAASTARRSAATQQIL
jgi:hypothetical protein